MNHESYVVVFSRVSFTYSLLLFCWFCYLAGVSHFWVLIKQFIHKYCVCVCAMWRHCRWHRQKTTCETFNFKVYTRADLDAVCGRTWFFFIHNCESTQNIDWKSHKEQWKKHFSEQSQIQALIKIKINWIWRCLL